MSREQIFNFLALSSLAMSSKTSHWDQEMRSAQKQIIASLSGEEQEAMALSCRVQNVLSNYYNEPLAEPTEREFEDWLDQLTPLMASIIAAQGLEKSKNARPLRLFTAQQNGLILAEYLKRNLAESDYLSWLELEAARSHD